MKTLKSLERLEESFNKLPTIGKRSAERLAYSILDLPNEDVDEFCNALKAVKNKIHVCPICGAYTEEEVCDVCADTSRDKSVLLVVSYPKDVISFEAMNTYRGLYHVLGGIISVQNGKSIDELNIAGLIERVKDGSVKELIIATNPTIEGETTAIYLSKVLKEYVPNITRLAYGLQMGGTLDYTDSLTLAKAIEGRRKI
ncbi:MAG: recombination mediator RecR [Bacilli bacterium]|nr:recombination mediator RecR [Bacilli bacterium]